MKHKIEFHCSCGAMKFVQCATKEEAELSVAQWYAEHKASYPTMGHEQVDCETANTSREFITVRKLKCVLCSSDAVTTAAHIPVCNEHFKQYKAEGRQYLSDRPFYNKLLTAYRKEIGHD